MSDPTIRELVTLAVLATQETVAGVTLFRQFDKAFEDGDLPALNVIMSGNPPPNDENYGLSIYEMSGAIEGTVTGSDSAAVDSALNVLYGQSRDALLADETLGGIASNLHEGAFSIDIDQGEGRQPNGTFRLEFIVEYTTATTSASTSGAA